MENILLIVAIFGLILTTIFLLKKDGFRDSTLFLALFYLILSIYCLQTWIIEAGLLRSIQWFYAWPLPIYSLLAPAVYFYFISILNDQFKWKWLYTLLFIPFFLSVLDVIILYSKSIHIYIEIVEQAIKNPGERFGCSYGFFSLRTHYILRNLWVLLSLIFLFPKLNRFVKLKSQLTISSKVTNWIKMLFLVLFILSFISTFFGFLDVLIESGWIQGGSQPFSIVILFNVFIVLLGVAPLYFPSILYGMPQMKVETFEFTTNEVRIQKEVEHEEGVRYGLNETVILELLSKIEMEEKYLQHDFNLDRLASSLEMPVHHVSYFLNYHFNLSFSEYRNRLRMQKAIELIRAGYFQQNTIEALAWKCGFSSRSAFTKTFKSFTGVNPSEFV